MASIIIPFKMHIPVQMTMHKDGSGPFVDHYPDN